MRIRTITTGIHLRSPEETDKIEHASEFNQHAKKVFENAGYEVQTTRISTNSWEEYLENNTKEEAVSNLKTIESKAKELDVSFFSIGRATTPERILCLPDINRETTIISCSANIGNIENGINHENIDASAQVIRRISEETENGYGNFRFCASANCKPGIPFFPTGFHEGKQNTFGIGLECGDLAMKAFSGVKNLQEAETNLRSIFESETTKVEQIAQNISEQTKMEYN